MKYINRGPKDGSKPNYIAVKGKRVYTGEEFEATPEDIKVFEGRVIIEPVSGSSFNEPVVQAFSDESSEDDFEFQTEEDAEASLSFFKNTINILDNEKGVK
jgi:hypothetical protein